MTEPISPSRLAPAEPTFVFRDRAYGLNRWESIGWRRRSVFGALGLRPPLADLNRGELEMILRYARGSARVVEIGVFEGGTAAVLRPCAERELVLIDPYSPGHLAGLNMARVVAHRAVAKAPGPPVRWLRLESGQAAVGWTEPIDFLHIDGLHTLEGVQGDWEDWNGTVAPGGHAVVRSDVVPEAVEDESAAGDLLIPWILERSPEWELVERIDTCAVLCRISTASSQVPKIRSWS